MKYPKETTCCFSGHRFFSNEQRIQLLSELKAAILTAIQNGFKYFLTGGALGFDTLAAQTVLELRQSYPEIKLILALPCHNQAAKWSKKEIEKYEQIKIEADEVIYICEEYTKECMLKRNRYMVDHSNLCICYMTKQFGGTAYTVRYAKKNGIDVINLSLRLENV